MKGRELEKIKRFVLDQAKVSLERGNETRTGKATHDETLSGVTCRLGDASCSRAHASTLRRSTGSRPGRAPRSLLELQSEYGNRYVGRVLKVARQGTGETGVAPEVEGAIERKRGGGQALDSATRGEMESAFGADFGGVRVHTDSEADGLNRSLSARAFTTGQDIFFRRSAYNPGSSAGRELLAHELTHVVQQSGGGLRRKLELGQPEDRSEQEAEQTARAVMEREREGVSVGRYRDPAVLRQAEPEEEEPEATALRRQAEEEENETPAPTG